MNNIKKNDINKKIIWQQYFLEFHVDDKMYLSGSLNCTFSLYILEEFCFWVAKHHNTGLSLVIEEDNTKLQYGNVSVRH